VALIVSVVALVRGHNRAAAIVGLVLSGLTVLLLFGYPLLVALCR
jgi:hypothetical protein